VVEKDGGKVRVNVWGKIMTFDGYDGFHKGDQVILVVRPEMIDLSSREGTFEGQVNLVTYLGSEVIYEVAANQQLFTVEVSNPLRHGIHHRGDKVFISLDTKNIYLIKE
jgi:ABC-type Fe3+/spermidine/putrescine transport system ATPase subunit